MFEEHVWLCLDCLIIFKLFFNCFFGLFLVSFRLLLVLFGCFLYVLVAWVLGVVVCCVKMLKVVFVCFSRCLFV